MGTLVRVLQPVDLQSLVSRRLYLRCFRTAHNCSNLVRLACPESLPCSHVGRIMVQRLRVFVLLACAAIEGAHAFQATAQTGGRQSPPGLGRSSFEANADNSAWYDERETTHDLYD